MEIVIKAEPKEIAELVLEIQTRQSDIVVDKAQLGDAVLRQRNVKIDV